MGGEPAGNHDVIVIGGGQAGLTAGYFLKRAGVRFVILERSERIGDVWRSRWDSLKLFTPAEHSGLPGLPFPAPRGHLPGKDEVAAYLARYAEEFDLPVRTGCTVSSLDASANGYRAESSEGSYEASNVIVATGPFQLPTVPAFASRLSQTVMQVHSSEYRNPAQLGEGPTLVVGAQASGLQIAEELAATRPVYVSVSKKPSPYIPRPLLGRDPFWWFDKTGFVRIPVTTRLGRLLSRRQEPLVGTSARRLRRSLRVRFFGRATDADGDTVTFGDGRSVTVQNVVWATGYRSDYCLIEAPVFDQRGRPIHKRGVTAAPGLFFLGLSWQHTRGSALIGWVGDDADFIVQSVQSRMLAEERL